MVVSDTGEPAGRRGTARRPLSRAASLLERGETTEVGAFSQEFVNLRIAEDKSQCYALLRH